MVIKKWIRRRVKVYRVSRATARARAIHYKKVYREQYAKSYKKYRTSATLARAKATAKRRATRPGMGYGGVMSDIRSGLKTYSREVGGMGVGTSPLQTTYGEVGSPGVRIGSTPRRRMVRRVRVRRRR